MKKLFGTLLAIAILSTSALALESPTIDWSKLGLTTSLTQTYDLAGGVVYKVDDEITIKGGIGQQNFWIAGYWKYYGIQFSDVYDHWFITGKYNLEKKLTNDVSVGISLDVIRLDEHSIGFINNWVPYLAISFL